MTFVAILNPSAAGGKHYTTWERIRKLLPPGLETWKTQYPGHATDLARAALQAGIQTVIAVGGDGTINEVVNGFFANGLAIATDSCLGVIPLGTGCDLARSLNLPLDPVEAAFVVSNALPRPIDVMHVRFNGADGVAHERFGINVTSFGIGGDVAARVNHSSKWLGGRISFLLATAATMAGHRGRTITLSLDGGPPIEMRITNVAIGNGRFHGAGMLVCPEAKPDDGLLDVTIIHELSIVELAKSFKTIYDGRILQHPRVTHHRVRSIQADGRQTTRLEIDGEAVGVLPVEIRVVPGAIRILA